MDDETKKTWLLCITLLLIVSSLVWIPPIHPQIDQPVRDQSIPSHPSARFDIASWSYPDAYGQGIYNITVEYYSNGSYYSETYYYNNSTISLIIDPSEDVHIISHNWLNSTLVGASTLNEGKNFFKHNITVMQQTVLIFSQQNFTDMLGPSDDYAPMYYYRQDVTIDSTYFPNTGVSYEATIYYEVFY